MTPGCGNHQGITKGSQWNRQGKYPTLYKTDCDNHAHTDMALPPLLYTEIAETPPPKNKLFYSSFTINNKL